MMLTYIHIGTNIVKQALSSSLLPTNTLTHIISPLIYKLMPSHATVESFYVPQNCFEWRKVYITQMTYLVEIS